jgi:hypothetical protein
MTTATFRCLLVALALWSGGEASAQRTLYRCTVDGQTSLSDRPCVGGVATGLGASGPARDARPVSLSSTPPAPKASSYLEYLSPPCAGLAEALRTGSARGLAARALYELRSSYQERCSDDDLAARKRFIEDLAKQRDARNSQLAVEKRERDLVTQTREQCDEMYRIAHGRRKKLDTMSAGERADFERFEANWKARCPPA